MLSADLQIRQATADDLPALRAIYARAVECLGPAAYSPAQVAVWKAFAGAAEFDDFILEVHTGIAVVGTHPVAFCGIADDGHVVSVYVRPELCGQGIGGTLLRQVLARHPAPTSGRYYAEASTFSLPLFKGCGFRQTGSERTSRDGVTFERFLVAGTVAPDDGADDS